jgi:MFS family permease
VAGWGAVPQAPKPGVIPLRPLSVGEILDGAISYIRRDPRTVLGISAGVALVLAVIQFVGLLLLSRSLDSLATDNATSDQALTAVAQLFGTAIVQGLAAFILNVLAVGLLTNVMGQAILGHRVTLAQAWARTAPRFWAMIGLTLLVSLIVGAVAFVGVLLAALVGWAIGSVTTGGVGATIGIVAGIATLLASVWVYIRLLLAPVALILENVGVTTALRRSWILVRAGWWRTFGIYLLGAVIAGIVGQILSVPFSVVGGLFTLVGADPNSVSLPFGYLLATALGVLVSTMVVLPFTSGVVALLYVDRRIRREALDIELARAAAA